MQMDSFLHTFGAEVTAATGSPTSGSEFIKLGIIYRLHPAQAIQMVSSRINSLEGKLNPTHADDLIKALLRASLKAMQAEQQVRQHQEALRAREARPVSHRQFLKFLLTLWLKAIKDEEAEQVADTLKYFWQQGYTIQRMAQTLEKEIRVDPEKLGLSPALVEAMKDAQHYLATGNPRRKEALAVRPVSQTGNNTPELSEQIIEIEDPETTSITTLILSPRVDSFLIYCYPGKHTTGKPLAFFQIGSYQDALEVLYWDATMGASQDRKRLVLVEHIQEQKSGAEEELRDQKYTILAFTDQGLRGMKVQAQGRIEQHQEDIERLNKLRTWLLEDGPNDEGPTALVAELTHHLETMFDGKVSALEDSIAVLARTVAGFEQGGY